MKKLLFSVFLSLLILSCSAPGNYIKKNLLQLSELELNEYNWKAYKLKKAGERLAIYGSISALVGLGIGSINQSNPMSSDGSVVVFSIAATLFVSGTISALVGVPMFIIGIARCNQINEIRRIKGEAMQLEFAPRVNYCSAIDSYHSGVSIRFRL